MNKLALLAGMDRAFAVDVRWAESAMVVLESLDPEAMYTPEAKDDDAVRYEFRKDAGAAIIKICGPTMRSPTSVAALFGGVVGTVNTARALRQAANDPLVRRIVMVFDSPGGQVNGTAELAEVIRKVSTQKPVIAYVDNIAMSAGYWLASACDEIVANKYGSVGSIGVFALVYDRSKEFADAGVKPILITSGGIKGQGAAGLPISDELANEIQRDVDDRYTEFVEHVMAMRGLDLDSVLAVADGRAFTSSEGMKLGLVDRLAAFDDLLAEFRNQDQKPVNSLIGKLFGTKPQAAVPETPVDAAMERQIETLAQGLVKAHVQAKVAALSEKWDATHVQVAQTVYLACLAADGNEGVPAISGDSVFEGEACAAFSLMLAGIKPSPMLAEQIKTADFTAYVVPSLDDQKAANAAEVEKLRADSKAKTEQYNKNKGVKINV